MKINYFDGKKNICGAKIREERLKRKMRQKDLAIQMQLRGVEIGRSNVSKIETNDRFVSDYEIKMLADIFNVSTDYLLGD